jgi:hypothetical protein
MATHVIGFLNSTDDKDLASTSTDPFVVGFRNGLGNAPTGDTWGWAQESAGSDYGHQRNRRKKLNNKARQLGNVADLKLIVASGGIVSARAAVRAGARRNKPVLICVGRDDAELEDAPDVAGVNLNTPAANDHRSSLILQRNSAVKEENIWLVVNSNSAMGRAERDQWEDDGRPFVETGKNRKNEQNKLAGAFTYAIDNGAEAFIISSDPFLTTRASVIRGLISTKPACFSFKQCLGTAAGLHFSWGHDLRAVYSELGTQARTFLTTNDTPDIVRLPPALFETNT